MLKRKRGPKSAAAKAGARRTKSRHYSVIELEAEWKAECRARDGNQCQFLLVSGRKCAVIREDIDVHHIAPRSRRKDLLYVVSNGVCLCRAHHSWVHLHPILATARGLLNDESYELASRGITVRSEDGATDDGETELVPKV